MSDPTNNNNIDDKLSVMGGRKLPASMRNSGIFSVPKMPTISIKKKGEEPKPEPQAKEPTQTAKPAPKEPQDATPVKPQEAVQAKSQMATPVKPQEAVQTEAQKATPTNPPKSVQSEAQKATPTNPPKSVQTEAQKATPTNPPKSVQSEAQKATPSELLKTVEAMPKITLGESKKVKVPKAQKADLAQDALKNEPLKTVPGISPILAQTKASKANSASPKITLPESPKKMVMEPQKQESVSAEKSKPPIEAAKETFEDIENMLDDSSFQSLFEAKRQSSSAEKSNLPKGSARSGWIKPPIDLSATESKQAPTGRTEDSEILDDFDMEMEIDTKTPVPTPQQVHPQKQDEPTPEIKSKTPVPIPPPSRPIKREDEKKKDAAPKNADLKIVNLGVGNFDLDSLDFSDLDLDELDRSKIRSDSPQPQSKSTYIKPVLRYNESSSSSKMGKNETSGSSKMGRQELPPEMLKGRSGKQQTTSFSSPMDPNAEPAEQSGFEKYTPNLNNIDLEKGEDLPAELRQFISAYDDELRNARKQDIHKECAIQLAIARLLDYAGLEKLAYVRYLKAFEADQTSRTAIHELRRIARAYNKSTDVFTLLKSEIEAGVSVEEQSTMLEESSLIAFFSNDFTPDQAIALLYQACSLTPRNVSPWSSLFYLLLLQKRYDECCKVLDKLTSLTEDKIIRFNGYLIKGDILTTTQPNTTRGMDSYLLAQDIMPSSFYAYLQATSILLRNASWQNIFKRTLLFADASQDNALKHATLIMAGSIAGDILSDPAASNQAYQQASSLDPADTTSAELYIDNCSGDPKLWESLDAALYSLSKATTVSPRMAIHIAILRAINLDKYGDATHEAIGVLSKVIEETNSQDKLIIDYCYRLLLKVNRIDDAMNLTKKLVAVCPPEEAAARFSSLGCYCFDILKKYPEAEINFKHALMLNPADLVAFEYLEHMMRMHNDFEGLVQIYRSRLGVTQEPKTKASLLHSLAVLCEYCLGQFDNALIYYHLYREIYPDDIHAVHNIQRLAFRVQNWKTVIEMLLVEKNSSPSPTERAALLQKIASICRYKMQNPTYAINFLKQAKDENPYSVVIYTELEEILTHLRKWSELISTYKDHLDILKNDDERILILNRLAETYEKELNDTRNATACYLQIREIDPENIFAATRLENIYRRTNDMESYYQLELFMAQQIQHPHTRVKLLFKNALKMLTVFKNIDRAIEILEMAYECQPDYVPTLFLLSLLYGATQRLDGLSTMMKGFTAITKTQRTKSDASLLVAYIQSQLLKQPNNALHPLELSLALTPNSISARVMLIQAQYERQMFTEIASLFSEGAQYMQDNAFAIHNYNFAAHIAHTFPTGNAYDTETSALNAVIDLDTDNFMANERLEAIEPARSNLVPFLEKRIKYANHEDKAELQLSIAECLFVDMPQQAFKMVCDIAASNTTHLPIVRVATNMAEKLNNPSMHCHFLSLQAQILETLEPKVIAWTNAARIARDQLKQPMIAIEYFSQAIRLKPGDLDICDQLIDLLVQKKDAAALENLMQIHLRAIPNTTKVARYMQMANIYLNEFNDTPMAVAQLREIIEIDENNIEVLWHLSQLELSLGHWSEARTVFERIIESSFAAQDVKHRSRAMLATLYIEHFDLGKRAIPLLQAVIAKEPNDIHALQQIADLYFSQVRIAEALPVYIKLISLVPAPDNLKPMLRIASIYQMQKDTDKLIGIIREIADIAKAHPNTLPEIKEWLDRTKSKEIMLAFLRAVTNFDSLPDETQIAIFEFASRAYLAMDMNEEADRYAVNAANVAPNSFEAQILASNVSNTIEAMAHAIAASRISPLNPNSYQAMLNIALKIKDLDLQARVEQQLNVLNAPVEMTPVLQHNFNSRYPRRSVDDDALRIAETEEFNPHIRALLQLAGPKAQIFALPSLPTEPLSSAPAIEKTVMSTATTFGLQNINIMLVNEGPFVSSQSSDDSGTLLFNKTALLNASEPERRFHIASALVHYRLGTLPIVTLPAENVSIMISGLLGLYDEKMSTPNVLSRIKSFLPRSTRKLITEYIASKGLQVFNFDPIQLQMAATTLDIHMGHVFSADLSASIIALFRRRKPNAAMPTLAQQWHTNYNTIPGIPALLAYNVSENYSLLRKKLRLFITSSTPFDNE